MYLKGVRWQSEEWIHVAQDRGSVVFLRGRTRRRTPNCAPYKPGVKVDSFAICLHCTYVSYCRNELLVTQSYKYFTESKIKFSVSH